MIIAPKEELEQNEEFQRIRARIKYNLSLPIDNLGEPTGATTDPAMYVYSKGSPEDADLVTIFRRMLDLGSKTYERELVEFLHSTSPPKINTTPSVITEDELLVSKIAIKIEAEREAAEVENKAEAMLPSQQQQEKMIKEGQWPPAGWIPYNSDGTPHVCYNPDGTVYDYNQENKVKDTDSSNHLFDFQCYVPSCNFKTNSKRTYETHVISRHPRKLCYPGKADLEVLGWTAQGRKWEV